MSSICGAAFQSNQKVTGYSPNTHFRPPIIITQRSAAGKMAQYFSPQWCKQSLLTPCQLTSRNETSMSVPTPCPMTQVRDIHVMVMMMKLAQRSRNNPPPWFGSNCEQIFNMVKLQILLIFLWLYILITLCDISCVLFRVRHVFTYSLWWGLCASWFFANPHGKK